MERPSWYRNWYRGGAYWTEMGAETMMNPEETLRIHAVNGAARGLGYRIEVETLAQSRTPIHRACYRLDDESPEGKEATA